MDRLIIVGLGNPEPKYAGNRHNIGFMVIDELARSAGVSMTRTKFKGVYGTGTLEGRPVTLLKPLTYMNLSGQSVVPASRFFDVSPDRMLVVHDELDLSFGTVRFKIGGGHAGHNGLRSIQAELGNNSFHRLRVGIGRPSRGSVSNFVLSNFTEGEETDWLPDLVDRCVSAIRLAAREGTPRAMNTVNAA